VKLKLFICATFFFTGDDLLSHATQCGKSSVPDPDPDPCVCGPLGSGSVIICTDPDHSNSKQKN
jgi:hypothetical protein